MSELPDVGAAKTMIDRTEKRFCLKPERLPPIVYRAAPMPHWLVKEVSHHTIPAYYANDPIDGLPGLTISSTASSDRLIWATPLSRR